MKKRDKEIPIEQLTAGYETFIKDKKVNSNGKSLFIKTLKKAIKQRGSK